MSQDEQRLLKAYQRLGATERKSLLDFADFLTARYPQQAEPPAEPELVPRPAGESVVAAIKRLSSSYHMLDRSKMLHETSALMTQHLMQGRPAGEVIDELEVLFIKYYERFRSQGD